MSDNLTRILNKAKIGFMSKPDSVFFTSILFSLKFSWDTTIPTACTDGLHLRVNPVQFEHDLNENQRIWQMAHEVSHVALGHMFRVNGRHFRDWNAACDHVINLMLKERGFDVPDNRPCDPRFKGMSADQVYNIIHQENQQQRDQQQQQNGGQAPDPNDPNDPANQNPDAGDFQTPDQQGMTPQEQAELQEEINNILVKAATQSKLQGDKPGTIPGDVEILLEELLNPKLSWDRILANYMTQFDKDDYTFSKPNRRFLPDFYLPSLYSEAMGEIAIAVDTSGSVTDEQFQEFISEIFDIHSRMKPSHMRIIDFDTRIQNVHEIKEGDDLLSVNFTGRGGTRINQVIDWIDEEKPAVTLIFTDGEFPAYPKDPGCPVIWVIHSGMADQFEWPFGYVIEYPD